MLEPALKFSAAWLAFNLIFVVMWWRMKSVTEPIKDEDEMDMVG